MTPETWPIPSDYFGKVSLLDLHLHNNAKALGLQLQNFMKDVTPCSVRQFLLAKYFESIEALGLRPVDLPDDFDFLLSGVIDSLGILEMIIAIEEEFQIKLDLTALDAEEITVLGPLSRYVGEQICLRVEKSTPNLDP